MFNLCLYYALNYLYNILKDSLAITFSNCITDILYVLTIAPVDYESKLHTVPIPNNRTLFHYTVMINDDDLFELNEVFTLEIKNSTHPKVMVGERATTTITVISEEHRKLFV